jgi:hypothetical protein
MLPPDLFAVSDSGFIEEPMWPDCPQPTLGADFRIPRIIQQPLLLGKSAPLVLLR